MWGELPLWSDKSEIGIWRNRIAKQIMIPRCMLDQSVKNRTADEIIQRMYRST